MTAKDVMTENVQLVSPDTSLREAAHVMMSYDIGCLPVCHRDRLVGIVTDRDIVVRALPQGVDNDCCRVQLIMSSPVVYCYEDEELKNIGETMRTHRLRRLPVLNRNKRLVGILTLSDIVIESLDVEIAQQILRGICQPLRPPSAA